MNPTPLSVTESAKILGISSQRVRQLCADGHIGASRIGKTWALDRECVINYGKLSGHILAKNCDAEESPRTKPIALSFFSGAMGLDLGIEEAGFDIRLACEFDKFCRQTISINRPQIALLSDINDYSGEDILKAAGLRTSSEVDLIVGGPPCQAFSTAGRRQGLNDARGNVFLKYIDLAIELKPKIFVIENVRGLLSCPMAHRPHDKRGYGCPPLAEDELKGGALSYILNRLKSSGYSYSFNLYNAANFGCPQIRERVVIMCSRMDDEIPYLIPTHSENGEYGLPRWKTFKDAVKGLTSCHHLNFPEKRLRFYRMLSQGQNWKNLPDELKILAMGKSYLSGGGKTGFYRRLAWDKPSPTLVTHPAMPATDLAHPEELRPLSIEEYKRIQEFPDDWKLAGPLVQQYKQVGNAVPKSLGYAIGKLANHLIQGEKVTQYHGFNYSRYKRTSHIEWEQDFRALSLSKTQDDLMLPLGI
jgi:DNA (cytosine-5)-methyltransferase 1